MTIVRRRGQEKRRDRRQSSNLTCSFQGVEFQVIDCSLGGIAIAGGVKKLTGKDKVNASLSIPNKDSAPIILEIPMSVTRIDEQMQQVAFHFDELSDEQFQILENYLTGRKTLL